MLPWYIKACIKIISREGCQKLFKKTSILTDGAYMNADNKEIIDPEFYRDIPFTRAEFLDDGKVILTKQ